MNVILLINVFQVTPNSVAHRVGLRPGDAIVQIGIHPAHNMQHQTAKMEIIRAGNELDFIIRR